MKDLSFLKDWKISHRGFHNLNKRIPENSMAAFKRALKYNYAIELDITMMKDGTIVCFHDKDLNRAANIDQRLADLTYNEINGIEIFKTKETIPRFVDVLNVIDGKVPLLIEVKAHKNYKLMLPIFIKLMKKYSGQFAVFSFSPNVVFWFKNNHPKIIRGQISSYFLDNKKLLQPMKYLMKSMFFNKLTKPDFISYHNLDLPNKYANKQKAKGLTVISYTASNQLEYERINNLYDNIVFENFIPK